jgi:hypothetical protein
MIGPDRIYRFGKPLCDGDEGGLYANYRVSKEGRFLAIDFGTTVTWVTLPAPEALEMAAKFRHDIFTNFGTLGYDSSQLPLVIKARKETGMVETIFPQPVGILAANPEVFLAWADKLDEAVKELGEQA